jgi:stearoyl-CoA desaturase (delta-9 desaturase)
VFFWSVHAITLAAIVLWFLGAFTISWRSAGLACVWFVFSTTTIAAGYHRLFAHPTYNATWPLRFFYLLAGAAAFQGSALQWSAQHRDHHTFTDQPKDPYNIKLGFWYAHMGWVVRETSPDYGRVRDLSKSALFRFQHAMYYPLAMLTCFILPCVIGMLWHEAIGALVMAGFLRLVIQWHMTFCVNSVAHCFGSQKYSTKHSARGSWWISFLVWGEMDHNFHHSFPNDFRTGTRWWDFDPGKWWIFLCWKVGLASDLRTADPVRIQRALSNTSGE